MNNIKTILTCSGIVSMIGIGGFIFLVKKALENMDSVEDDNDGSFRDRRDML